MPIARTIITGSLGDLTRNADFSNEPALIVGKAARGMGTATLVSGAVMGAAAYYAGTHKHPVLATVLALLAAPAIVTGGFAVVTGESMMG